MGRLKELVKRALGERGRLYVRRGGRLRWLRKARRSGGPAWSGRPLRRARYVLLDPEVDTFSYVISNEEELATGLADVLGVPLERVRELLREARTDPGIARDVGWHAAHHKLHPTLVGHQLAAYVAVRVRTPEVCVETGILDGLGSRTILRALARNAAEGSPGRLWSFDLMPGTGWLVSERLRSGWTQVIGDATEQLAAGVVPGPVGFYLHDSHPDPEYQRRELEWAFAHATPGAVVITVHGWSGVLQELATTNDARSFTFTEQPVDHFYTGETITIGVRPLNVNST